MFYRATVSKSGKSWLVSFADCEGCLTQGDSRAEAIENAHEALEGWLEAHLALGNAPPRPRARKGDAIEVAPQLSAVLQIRWRRAEMELTQGQLAKRAGVSQQQIAKLEDPDGNPTVATLQKIAGALGLRLELNLVSG
ncbi:MAG TPA: type II toxin-antitoxin system HicB family antitoxin [Polyangiaceae bacterium]|nr:type II toxin-antitoxin system HicB family antitoxin [Polyangiaceae bacterium]